MPGTPEAQAVCTRCGTENPLEARFCNSCGAELAGTEV
jgi:ribosomal protein L40E